MRWSRLAMGFCPQFRSGRRLYAQETTGALLAGLFLWLMINPIADAEFISDEMLTWIGRFVYQSHSYLHDRVRGAQAARCRSFGGLGTVRDVSGRKYFSDAVPAAAPRRLTANGLETSGRGCRVRLGVKTWRLPSRKTCS